MVSIKCDLTTSATGMMYMTWSVQEYEMINSLRNPEHICTMGVFKLDSQTLKGESLRNLLKPLLFSKMTAPSTERHPEA